MLLPGCRKGSTANVRDGLLVVAVPKVAGAQDALEAPEYVLCFEWKNSTNCAHLTFRVLGSLVSKSAHFEPTFPRFLRLWRDFDHLWVSAATRFARDGCLWGSESQGLACLAAREPHLPSSHLSHRGLRPFDPKTP